MKESSSSLSLQRGNCQKKNYYLLTFVTSLAHFPRNVPHHLLTTTSIVVATRETVVLYLQLFWPFLWPQRALSSHNMTLTQLDTVGKLMGKTFNCYQMCLPLILWEEWLTHYAVRWKKTRIFPIKVQFFWWYALETHKERIGDALGTQWGRYVDALGTQWWRIENALRTHRDALGTHWRRIEDALGT